MELIFSKYMTESPAALRSGLHTFIRVAEWRTEPGKDAPLPYTTAWKIAHQAARHYLVPGAIIHKVAARYVGKHSFLAVLVEVPDDPEWKAGEYYFHLKKSDLHHMALRGYRTLAEGLEKQEELRVFYWKAAKGEWPKCVNCQGDLFHTTDETSPYFRRCLSCNPPAKV